MSIFDRFKKGEISRKELRDMAEKDPSLRTEIASLLNEEMSDDELEGIAAAGYIRGGTDDDFLVGTDGNDTLYGRGGADFLSAGDGDDKMDGGARDGAGDVAFGGDGDDTYYWGLSKDGSDTFIGGEGTDVLKLDLELTGNYDIKGAFESGAWDISVLDSNNNPIQITDDMWDSNGHLNLPPGSSGQIIGPTGETLSFSDVEIIRGLK